MAKKVRIGFIGAGYMGQNAHIANYAKIDDCELVALAEGRPETARAVADRYGIQTVYPSHHEMLAEAELDGVVGIMGFHVLRWLVEDVLNAGVPLITEKPMCIRADNGRRLADIAAANDTHYQVGYMKRHAPASIYVRDAVAKWKDSGECGALTYMRVTMPPGDWIMEHEPPISRGDSPPPYDGQEAEGPPDWMTEEQGHAYVSFVNFYIHQVNLIRFLIGEDYRVTYADPSGRTMTAISDSGVVIVLEMAGYGLQHRWEESYRLHFDSARIDLDIPSPMARQRGGEVTVYRQSGFDGSGGPQEMSPYLPQRWPFEEQARAFVASLKDGAPNVATGADSVRDLEISEEYIRAVESSRSA
ncbi:Gfo/Idh/MocA family oxidoreductase [Candidatus Poribacteria bacterium]|nr:Gfo/Idh/MocA family oxidoreductase [Candidatus Poribacteria bacterium]